ncbi:MAG: WD40 repeat domain-containing protein [Vulcanimicrobiota bacterium]
MLTRTFLLLLLTLVVWAEPAPQIAVDPGVEPQTEFSADGKTAAVWGEHFVSVFDVTRFSRKARLNGFDRVANASLSWDGRYLAVGDYPSRLDVYDAQSGKLVWNFRGPVADPRAPGAYSVRFAPKGYGLLVWGTSHGRTQADTHTRLYDGQTGRQLQSWSWPDTRWHSLVWAADGKSFARGGFDKLQLYAFPSGQKLREVRLGGEFLDGQPGQEGVLCRHMADNGSRAVKGVYAWKDLSRVEESPDDEADFPTHPDGRLRWEKQAGNLVVLDSEGKAVFTGGPKDTLKYWAPGAGFVVDGEGGLTCYSVSGESLGRVPFIAERLPGSSMAVQGVGYGGPGGIYDLATGKELGHLEFMSGTSVSFPPEGSRLLLCTKKGLLFIDVPASLREQKLVPLGEIRR